MWKSSLPQFFNPTLTYQVLSTPSPTKLGLISLLHSHHSKPMLFSSNLVFSHEHSLHSLLPESLLMTMRHLAFNTFGVSQWLQNKDQLSVYTLSIQLPGALCSVPASATLCLSCPVDSVLLKCKAYCLSSHSPPEPVIQMSPETVVLPAGIAEWITVCSSHHSLFNHTHPDDSGLPTPHFSRVFSFHRTDTFPLLTQSLPRV